MSKIVNELDDAPDERLQPANSATVRLSFGLGFTLLIALVIASHLVVTH